LHLALQPRWVQVGRIGYNRDILMSSAPAAKDSEVPALLQKGNVTLICKDGRVKVGAEGAANAHGVIHLMPPCAPLA
jgi:hypothetical protein